jgi:site-specific recombinase XerC
VNLIDAISYHQLVLASEGRTEATQRQYMHFQRVFLRYLESVGVTPGLDALNPTNVRAGLAWYQTLSAPQRTRGGEVAGMVFVDTIHTWARFLEREGILDDDPLRKMRRVKITKRLRQPLSQTEAMALWGAARTSPMALRDEALFLLLLDTGMRIGEACTITLDALKLDERHIIIGAEGKGRASASYLSAPVTSATAAAPCARCTATCGPERTRAAAQTAYSWATTTFRSRLLAGAPASSDWAGRRMWMMLGPIDYAIRSAPNTL